MWEFADWLYKNFSTQKAYKYKYFFKTIVRHNCALKKKKTLENNRII